MDDRTEYRSPSALNLPRSSEATSPLPSKSLYVSHFLSTWNARGFEFGAVLFLATIYPGTLLPVSVYALVRAAAATVLSHKVGHYIDTQGRLTVVRVSIIGQRFAVALSCVGFLFLLANEVGGIPILNNITFVVITVLACVEKLCYIMNTVAVERDWVVVIAVANEDILQELNSQIRRIDLFCKLVAPLAISLVDGTSTRTALQLTLGFNVVSAGIEYLLIEKVYHRTPTLGLHKTSLSDADEDQRSPPQTNSLITGVIAMLHDVVRTIRAYVHSPVFLPSFALSTLYLTVLSFSGQMTTFLLATPEVRLTSTTIGLLRTGSTFFEISATYAAQHIVTKFGPVRAGIWCLSWQSLCLTGGVGLLWSTTTTHSAAGVMFFVTAVIFSRVGLWSFDLVAQNLIQHSTDVSQRGSFSSTEASLQNFFELCTFAMTIVFPKPEQFKIPALASLVATYCAAASYAKFVRDRRGHLVHIPGCLKPVEYDRYEMVNTEERD